MRNSTPIPNSSLERQQVGIDFSEKQDNFIDTIGTL